MSAGQKFRENLDEVVLAFLVLVAFAPLLILGLPVFSSVGDFLVFRYFGIAWVFLGYDNYLSSRWRVPSLNKAIRAIEKRKSRLEQNLLRISDELERIGPGGQTKLILEAREKLRFGQDEFQGKYYDQFPPK